MNKKENDWKSVQQVIDELPQKLTTKQQAIINKFVPRTFDRKFLNVVNKDVEKIYKICLESTIPSKKCYREKVADQMQNNQALGGRKRVATIVAHHILERDRKLVKKHVDYNYINPNHPIPHFKWGKSDALHALIKLIPRLLTPAECEAIKFTPTSVDISFLFEIRDEAEKIDTMCRNLEGQYSKKCLKKQTRLRLNAYPNYSRERIIQV